MPKINSEMIRLARESRGLSQSELCEKLSIAQGTVSKVENRLIECSEDLGLRVANLLDYPMSFFYRQAAIFPSSILYYRRKITASKKGLSKAEARMNIIRMGIETLLENVEVAEHTLGQWNVETMGTPELAAKFLREKWRVSKGRIENLTALLEKNGIFVFHFDFESEKLEGLSFFTEKSQPIIFVNRTLPGDRLRLTLAHELGHLFMHIGQPMTLERDVEKEAFAFASEFLVPLAEFKTNARYIDLKFLAAQKMYWMVSMSSLVYKASDQGLLSPNQAKYLFSQLSALGYRKAEPSDLNVKREMPTLIKTIVDMHKKDLGFTSEEIAGMLHLSFREFETEFNVEPFGLRVIRRNR